MAVQPMQTTGSMRERHTIVDDYNHGAAGCHQGLLRIFPAAKEAILGVSPTLFGVSPRDEAAGACTVAAAVRRFQRVRARISGTAFCR